MENRTITRRLSLLREKMSRLGIDYFLIPTADYHNSEYVAPYFQTRAYFCGFTGSNGTLIIGMEEAGLWTDGRYFIQAEKEIRGTDVDLYREGEEGVPTVAKWLSDRFEKAAGALEDRRERSRVLTLGFDGRCVSVARARQLQKKLSAFGVRFVTDIDPAEGIWTDRPERPAGPAFVLKDKYTGESAPSRLDRLRGKMRELGAGIYVENRLENLMWLFNLRGRDVECTPVSLCFGVITMKDQVLFIQESAVTGQVQAYADGIGLELRPYEDVFKYLEQPGLYRKEPGVLCRALFDPASLSVKLREAMQTGRQTLALNENIQMPLPADAERGPETPGSHAGVYFDVEKRSPVEDFKAVKNAVELENIRDCYREDSAAVCRFLYWLHRSKENGTIGSLTEMDAAAEMDRLRAEISDFVDLSFGTISAYGPNAAMMHYTAKEGDCARLQPEGMLLVDCGGQYLRGTTDVTRTIALGPVTQDMRRHYTLTAVGNLQLMDAVFLYGCTGRNVDILARQPLWRTFVDYKCGTGHGIGYLLSVHEGPQNIRWRFIEGMEEALLEPGMIVSDEPGVYIEGRYGIRIETILEVVEAAKNSDGRFLRFEPLTLVPLDPALIDPAYLPPRSREVLDAYHARVYEEISPLLTREESEWLYSQTRPVEG